MPKLCLLVFAAALCVTGARAPAQSQIAPASTTSAELKSFFEDGARRNSIVGASLVTLRDGKVAFQDFYGRQNTHPAEPVDENTTYHWASITKTFTGIAIMQLRDRGLLALDDPLLKYIPELSVVHNPYGPVSAITIRQAMSHSAGFRDPTWPWRTAPWQPFEPAQWSQIVAIAALQQCRVPARIALQLFQSRCRLSRRDH